MQPDDYYKLIEGAHDIELLEFTVPRDWGQGRTVFGGLSAGILYQALRKAISTERLLRSLTFNFVGPLKTDVPFRIDLNILREGKNATQISATIIQEKNVCLTALGCFAVDRNSNVIVKPLSTTLPSTPHANNYIKLVPNVTPTFLKHIHMSVSAGEMPFSGSKQSHYKGWMRLKQTPKAITDAHIITLVDAWPPTILQSPKQPSPASTMSWNIELMHPQNKLEPEAWLAYQANTIQAHGGYAHSEATIHDESGNLLAVSRQLVAIFD